MASGGEQESLVGDHTELKQLRRRVAYNTVTKALEVRSALSVFHTPP